MHLFFKKNGGLICTQYLADVKLSVGFFIAATHYIYSVVHGHVSVERPPNAGHEMMSRNPCQVTTLFCSLSVLSVKRAARHLPHACASARGLRDTD